MLDKLTLEVFEPVIGDTFEVTLPDSDTVSFQLTDVEELPMGRQRRNAPKPRRKPFSVFFTGPILLPQAMYPIRHAVLGDEPVAIFIVPINEVDGGYEYEAVFT